MLSGQAFQTGVEPFQAFSDLMTLRDAVMHGHPVPTGKARKVIQSLTQRGLTLDKRLGADENTRPLSWLNRLMSPEVAVFCGERLS
jgi:hypothetical protein